VKTLKFYPKYVSQIMTGTKTVTWRLFDDKDLQAGDELTLVNKETGEEFAKAKITGIREKRLGDINNQDHKEHGPMDSEVALLESFRKIYGPQVSEDTMVKMVSFKLA
jgi:hypothetical protein